LATLHARELMRGNRNRATLAVARKLVAYLLAVDKSGQPFQVLSPPAEETEARLEEPDAGTVLAVKGSLRRAKSGRALDGCGPFRRRSHRDERLRRENNKTLLCAAPPRFASDPPAVPRVFGDCHREVFLLMGHIACFEAGRFTQTQTSRTAPRCSRKWMSGPADAWAERITDRPRKITGQFVGPTTALQETLPSAGGFLSSLDKSLSWTSPKC